MNKMLLLVLMVFIFSGGVYAQSNATEEEIISNDLLIYDAAGTGLMLYDPSSRTSTALIGDYSVLGSRFSADGVLAFASGDENHREVYTLDVVSTDASPVNISQSPTTDDAPLDWSPDGRYLAFASGQEDELHIYVWDSETKTAVNITPDDLLDTARFYPVAWSFDGRLAFTVSYGSSEDKPPSEIYLWDGNTTTNLSQNPTGDDNNPLWNRDGELAFLSIRDGEWNMLVWDGVSLEDGLPDSESFTNVAIGLIEYQYSPPVWTNDGLLAFITVPPYEHHTQIFVWGEQIATNISQNPNLHNGSPRWSRDGRWAFVTFFSGEQLLYVRDTENRTLLTVQGQYPPAWSLGGNLLFCRRRRPGWSLFMWDGWEIVEIVQGNDIVAKWQGNPDYVWCTSG